jgi:HAE1 family hydrophobic/amphiphilic exporter-1
MRRWSLSDLALARPVTIGMTLVAVFLLGIIGLAKMPLSFLPREDAARVYVKVEITRTSPEVLERELIRPLEESVAGLRGLQRIQVGSGAWGVRMNLEFEPGSDADARKLELRDRVDRVRGELPEFVQNIEIGSYSRNDEPIMEMRISSGADLSEDYYLIEQHIVRPIERVEGVARVELEGVAPHELEIAVDLDAIERTGVSLAEVGAVVRDARQGHSLGEVRDAQRNAGVRSPAEPANAERFGRLPLRRSGEAAAAAAAAQAAEPTTGTPAVQTPVPDDARFAALDELAEISIHPEEERRGNRLNGRQAIHLEVFAAAGASTVEVTQAVRAAVDEMQNDAALGGIELLVFHDEGEIILRTLSDLRDTGIYGGLLAVFVLFLFLHRGTTTLAASLSVPLSVLAAAAVLYMRGEELNCIVLLGLVLGVGMLIDNAVVIVEAIASHSRAGHPPLEAARLGAREVGFATIASTLSTVIVFLPLIVNDQVDEMAHYLRVLGTTFAICLVASLLISQTSVPLLMGRMLKVVPKPTRHPVLERIAAGYGWLVRTTLKVPRLTLLFGLMLAGLAVWPAMNLEVKLGAADRKPDHLPIRLEFAGSRGYESIEKKIVVLEAALLENTEALGIKSVSCSYSDHWSNCRVYPAEAFESEQEIAAFETRVREVLPEQIGVKYRVNETEFSWRDNSDKNVVEFAIKGEDMGTLMPLAERVGEHLEANLVKGDPDNPEAGGVDLITTPMTDGARELHVVLDGARLRAYGLEPDDVARRVSLAFQGMPLGRVRGERGEVRLRLSAEGQGEKGPNVDDVRDLRLPLADGSEIQLGSIAKLELERRPWWIQRVDRQTEVRVKVRFFQADPKANYEAIAAAMESFTMPPGYAWGRGTQWKMQKEANLDMLVNLGLCLLLVYAVMASLFESYLQPFGILLTCLLGTFGAPWAMWVTGTTVDATAIVGLFILVGVVVNNGIMLVDRTIQLRASGMGRVEALEAAGRDRLRPILMTVGTTVLGLVPMLIHHPTLAGVYYHAIAIVIAGGLTTSTIVTLVVLPAAYSTLEDISLAFNRTWRRFRGTPRGMR